MVSLASLVEEGGAGREEDGQAGGEKRERIEGEEKRMTEVKTRHGPNRNPPERMPNAGGSDPGLVCGYATICHLLSPVHPTTLTLKSL